MDMNVIKSYLVQLGAKIDDTSWNQTVGKVKELEKTIETVTSSMSKSFTTASSAITGALIGVTTATGGLLDHVSQLDMGYQKFALSMYMSTKQAKELKIVTDAMGENINDIAWIPELRQRYMSLMQETQTLEAQIPGGGEAMMRGIRNIRFEFTRLKVEATYALQWIAMHIINDLNGPLFNFKGGIHELNDWIVSNMPVWTKKVADFFVKFATDIWKLVPDIEKLIDWFKKIPDILKKVSDGFKNSSNVIIEFGAIFLGVMRGLSLPLSLFAGLIAGVIMHLGKIQGTNSMWQDFVDLVKNATDGFDNFTNEVAISLEKNGAIDAIIKAFHDWGNALSDINKGLTSALKSLGLLGQRKGIGEMIADEFSHAAVQIAKTASFLAHLFSALGKALSGDLTGAVSELKLAGKDFSAATSQNPWGRKDSAGKSSGGGGGGSSSSGNESTAWNFFKSKGYSSDQVSGIIGNLMTESNLDPNSKSGDGSYGIAQWRGGRLQGLYDFASKNGSDASDINTQLAYIEYELNNSESNAKAQLQNSSGAKDSAYAFSKYYERPAWSENPQRQDNAADVYARNASYNPSLMAKASLLSNYNVGTGANAASSIDQSTTTGNIIINITEPGANQDQIKSAVMTAIKQANNKSNARMIDNFAGVGVTMV
jgi:predicted PurR-regulated permease PerM